MKKIDTLSGLEGRALINKIFKEGLLLFSNVSIHMNYSLCASLSKAMKTSMSSYWKDINLQTLSMGEFLVF